MLWASSIPAKAILSHGKLLKFPVRLLTTNEARGKGLSGVKNGEFSGKEGALFLFKKSGLRRFWMPNTFFDLDLIYLDKKLKVIGIQRGLKHHPGYGPNIEVAKTTLSQHVLELKSNTDLARSIKIGMNLSFEGASSLSQILQDTHPAQ